MLTRHSTEHLNWKPVTDDKLVIVRRNGDAWAKLSTDFKAKKFEITYTEDGEVHTF